MLAQKNSSHFNSKSDVSFSTFDESKQRRKHQQNFWKSGDVVSCLIFQSLNLYFDQAHHLIFKISAGVYVGVYLLTKVEKLTPDFELKWDEFFWANTKSSSKVYFVETIWIFCQCKLFLLSKLLTNLLTQMRSIQSFGMYWFLAICFFVN